MEKSEFCKSLYTLRLITAFFILFFFLFSGISLIAQAYDDDFIDKWDYTINQASNDDESEEEHTEEQPDLPKKKFRMPNRSFEIGFNANFNYYNSALSLRDIFKRPIAILKLRNEIKKDFRAIYQDKITINIDDFFYYFNFGFLAEIKPISIRINSKDKWGFGLDIGHIEASGEVSLPGDMLDFSKSKKIKTGAYVFADIGIPFFFHVNEFKLKFRPAVYAPLLYNKVNFNYSFSKSYHKDGEGMRVALDYKIELYSITRLAGLETGNLNELGNYLSNNFLQIMQKNLGFDMGFGIEYPLYSWLDIGADIANFPVFFVGAKLNNSMELSGNAFFDTGYINLAEVIKQKEEYKVPEEAYSFKNIFNFTQRYGKNAVRAYRPFKMVFYGNIRPFDTPIISFIPSLGFSVNQLYEKPGTMEGGLTACLDLGNMLIIKGGINHNDRRWKNSLDFILNFRALELDIGISSQAKNFVKSFKSYGAGVDIGLKLGF